MYKAWNSVEYNRCWTNGLKKLIIIILNSKCELLWKQEWKLRITTIRLPQNILLIKRNEKKLNLGLAPPSYTAEKDARTAHQISPVFPNFILAEDTSWIIHVRFSCVKKWMCAQELWHQGKHQGWMPTSQKLQAPETNKMRVHLSNLTNALKSTGDWNQKTWFRNANSQPPIFGNLYDLK